MAVLAFCVGAAYWPGIYSGYSMPKWWVMWIGLAIIPWGFRNLDRTIAWCAAGGVLMAAWSLAVTPHLYGGTFDLICIILLCGVAVGAAALDDAGPVVEALSWGVAISVAASVLQFFGWYIAPHTGYAGFYLNPEIMGELAAPLLVWAFWSQRWVLAGIMATSVLLCHSRIAFFVAGCGLLFGWRAPRVVKLTCVVALLSAGITAVLFIGPEKYLTGMTRVMYWTTAVMSLTLDGRGLAWWAAAHPFPMEEFVHSDVLQAMLEIGWGSLFFIAIPVMVLFRGGGIAERAAYIAICVEALVSFPMHLPATGFLAAVLTGNLARRWVDSRVPGVERGIPDHGAVRWAEASAGNVAVWDGRCGRGVSYRPAHSEFTDRRAATGEGTA